jgi:N-methylhydantoinase B/oxoprolinase/acetone carboxylase alpha subunit
VRLHNDRMLETATTTPPALISDIQARINAMMGITERIAALEVAMGSGERVVQFRDERVEYHSVKDMLLALSNLRSRLADLSPARSGAVSPFSGRTLLAHQTGKGL